MAIAREFSDLKLLYSLWHDEEFRTKFPVLDVYSTPGMPPVGVDFVALAEQLLPGELAKPKSKQQKQARDEELRQWVNCLYWQALYNPNFRLPVPIKGAIVQAQFVGGHLWNYDACGPSRSESSPQVMIIGKNPQLADVQQGRNFVDAQGELLQRALLQAGFSDTRLDEVYVTNVVKHGRLDPSSNKLAASWVKNCLPILFQEIAIVRPDFILLLGSEPLKLLIHKSHNVSDMVGRVLTLDYRDWQGEIRQAKVISAVHPSSVAHEPQRKEQLESSCRDFRRLVDNELESREETDIEHIVVDNSEDLEVAVQSILDSGGDLVLAVDCEWHGEAPYEPGAFLRTIQISHRAKASLCVVLHRQGGAPAFDPKDKCRRTRGRNDPGVRKAVDILKRLFFAQDRRVRVGGHFFRSDLPWLMDVGLDLRELYAPPRADGPGRLQASQRMKYEGGFDTGLMFFAISETSELKLETLAMKYTTAPRYDLAKEAELVKYCKENKLSRKKIEGFGFMTDDTLHRYANYDADVTRRLFDVAAGDGTNAGLLDSDEYGLNCWDAYYMSHRASLAFLEMEQTGIEIDRRRALELIDKFNETYRVQLSQFRERIRWPSFNPKSVDNVREFLFGEELARLCKKTGQPIRLRPKNAVCKYAEPIKSSGKPSTDWRRVVDADETHIYRPSTDKETLGILGRVDPDIWLLRQIRFTGQILQTVLRLPEDTDSVSDYVQSHDSDDMDDDFEFDGGMLSHVRSDGRVHTRLSQTKETGRAGSSNPNMQNMCFDESTEFLTYRGWVLGRDLKETDMVGEFYRPAPNDGYGKPLQEVKDDTFEIRFVQPEAIHVFDHDGPMIRFELPQTIDLLVTPNHRMVAFNSRTNALVEDEAINWKLHNPQLIISGGRLRPAADCEEYSAEAIGAFFVRLLAKTDDLVQVGWSEYYLLDRGLEVESQVQDLLRRFEADWLALFLHLGANARESVRSYARMFFLQKKKGNRLRGAFADLVQACFSLDALSVGSNFDSSGNLQFRFTRRAYPKFQYSHRPDNVRKLAVPYTGKVYCVTVPSSFVVVRRNGCITVSGNSKRREKDYKEILGEKRYAPVRSMIVPAKGHVLVEADYKSAELAMIGWASQCPQMIEDVKCNNLPESDPRHVDIHTRTAVTAFKLDLGEHRPTKTWIENILKRGDLRVGAKTVNFGIPYGRGDESTARTCREEGVSITLEQAAALREAYFERYPEIQMFLQEVAERAVTTGWISGWARRYRRFAPTSDEKLQKAQGREACNFPIQNGVAEAMDIALDNLYRYRETHNVKYRIALQVHDAVLLEVPKPYVVEVVKEVLPYCMDESVHVWPKYLDGESIPVDDPYHFGIDTEVFYRWGVKLTAEEKAELGV